MPAPLFMADRTGLQTELFQLVQAAVYHADGLWGEATFDLYLKSLPHSWGFVVAAGIEPAIQGALGARFSEEEIAWLRRHPALSHISDYFFETLREFVFSGDIDAMPEGTLAFPGQPIVRITAPLQQAGLVESRLIQTIAYASGVATRAVRLKLAARGGEILDFGSRRCSGPEAAWSAARAAWIGGCAATTNALAAHTLHIPDINVISRSILAAYQDSASAYEVLRIHGSGTLYLDAPPDLDAGLADLEPITSSIRCLRLDHHNLDAASRQLRAALDRRGMGAVQILGSGSLGEAQLAALVASEAPLDRFGVGSSLTAGHPGLHLSYRMAELFRGPAPEPVSGPWASRWPGRKQILRSPERDILCLESEASGLEGAPLLQPRVRGGEPTQAAEPLSAMRDRCAVQLAALPAGLHALAQPQAREQVISRGLRELSGQ